MAMESNQKKNNTPETARPRTTANRRESIDATNFSARKSHVVALYRQLVTREFRVSEAQIAAAIADSAGQRNTVVACDPDSRPPLSDDATAALLAKIVCVKLSGGLGTSMACAFPKALIEVRDDTTLLDLCVRQLVHYNTRFGANVPLALMTSFHTRRALAANLAYYRSKLDIHTFEQSAQPRIDAETHSPLPDPQLSDAIDPSQWYPPGHGEFYESFARSGLLAAFIAQGREWAFVSNIDNPGAQPDPRILAHIQEEMASCDFCAEVTPKTLSDVKGGVFIRVDGQIRLIESAQIPESLKADFKGNSAFKYFNTNNLWINLRALKSLVDNDQISTDVISNIKRLPNNRRIVQLESAISSAARVFAAPACLAVSRDRFMPIKTCDDLLPLLSGLVRIDPRGFCALTTAALPLIKLGQHFASLREFGERMGAAPELTGLTHLTVAGRVRFGRGVRLRGNVIIIASDDREICIPDGATLENVVVTGALSILDH